MKLMFNSTFSLEYSPEDWDVSRVTNMKEMFNKNNKLAKLPSWYKKPKTNEIEVDW